MFYAIGPGRLATLERWLPYTATVIDSFYCKTKAQDMF